MNKIKLLFVDGSSFDFEKPTGFELQAFVHGCRSIGMVLTNGFYVPFGLVKAVIDMELMTQYSPAAVVPSQNAPSTETRQ
jgi:hypothetical protein